VRDVVAARAIACSNVNTQEGSNMIRRKQSHIRVVGVAAVALASLGLAACGSSSKSTSSGSARPTTGNGQAATIGVAKTKLGSVLVDAQGRTLYLFRKDAGTTSECTGACATFWPPLSATGTPTTDAAAKASLVGTSTRSDGTTQVTYNGHPVYQYSGDHSPGDTNGEGINAFGGLWYALSGAGKQVTGSSANSSGNGGSGY
jgi:predicted lipoprotein with Yx(FWY)xxD motif